VVENLFSRRVPPDLTAKAHCDIGQVARRRRTVLTVDIRYRLRAAIHAVEELQEMMRQDILLVAIRFVQANRIRIERPFSQFIDRRPLELAATDKERATISLKGDAVLLLVVAGVAGDGHSMPVM